MSAGAPLLPGPADVHVWWIDLAAVADAPVAILSADELARAERFRFPRDRDRWVRARVALRRILAAYVGTPPETLRLVARPGGKPALASEPALRFSLTHAGGRAALAVAWEREVGIDLEPVDPSLDIASLLAVACAPAEIARLEALPAGDRAAAFLTLWTLKEAYFKALGTGLARQPLEIAVALGPGGRAAVHDPHVTSADREYSLRLLDAGSGWVAALAVAGAPAPVRDFRWPLPGVDPGK
jgi:4'-phosphopantetheinyl transferase